MSRFGRPRGGLLLIAACALSMAAGCIVRTGADTALYVRVPDSPKPGETFERTFGFRDVFWTSDETGDFILGYGSHPREHETYWFIGCEPYYASYQRYLHVTPVAGDTTRPDSYRIELVFYPWLAHLSQDEGELPSVQFIGEAPSPAPGFFWSRRLELDQVELVSPHSSQKIIVSGVIDARPGTPDQFAQHVESYTQLVRDWGRPIQLPAWPHSPSSPARSDPDQ